MDFIGIDNANAFFLVYCNTKGKKVIVMRITFGRVKSIFS